MADVFISYKKEDRPHAERVAQGFARNELSVWWDDDILPREAWDKTIEREIAEAAAVVVLWSPRAVLSDWVRTEAHYGHDHGKLVPAMIEACEKPIAFMLTQTVDLSGWSGADADPRWRKLLAWVADLRAPPATAAGAAGPAPNPFRQAIGELPSGEPVVGGSFVNLATPAGTVFRDATGAPAVRIVPRGEFIIGSPPGDPDRANVEGPQKRIEIHRPFAMGVYPVLRAEYEVLMGVALGATQAAAPARGRWFGRPPPPPAAAVNLDPAAALSNVSFDDAELFAERLSAMTGQTYRLPSESEWEYACRGGSRTRYGWGDDIDAAKAIYRHDAAAAPGGPVVPGARAPNRFGLYDMHGNVREWTSDIWHESYEFTPSDGGPALEGQGSMRVVRGGGWSDPAAMLRASARSRATQSIRSDVIGCRLVRVLE